MKLSNIVASLNHGKFFAGKSLRVCYACLIISVLALFFMIMFVLITAFAPIEDKVNWDAGVVIAIIGYIIFFALLCVVCLVSLIHNHKLKNNILLWISDAVKIKAFSTRMDFVNPKFKPYQIQIEFESEGQKYVKVSASGSFLTGYHKIFKYYADREINILYSPKYDQVLILKDNI